MSLAAVGGTATVYENNEVSSRHQARSTKRLDLLTENRLTAVKDRILGIGSVTYRPESVQVTGRDDATVLALSRIDIGRPVTVIDSGRVTFTGYRIAAADHAVSPLDGQGVYWQVTYRFQPTESSDWSN